MERYCATRNRKPMKFNRHSLFLKFLSYFPQLTLSFEMLTSFFESLKYRPVFIQTGRSLGKCLIYVFFFLIMSVFLFMESNNKCLVNSIYIYIYTYITWGSFFLIETRGSFGCVHRIVGIFVEYRVGFFSFKSCQFTVLTSIFMF